MPGIVCLSITQIQVTPFHLAPWWLWPITPLTRTTLSHTTTSLPLLLGPTTFRFHLISNTHILKVDFFPKFQTDFQQL
ncbi:hypothetical protein HanPSC8_Chr10g0417891 [Helianthus annuus]|nr:hypothetical protein HanPSC8_Chr10g0417891 [Helianthus annuus]